MIGEYKIAAFCTTELQYEDVQAIIYPLYKKLEKIGWKLFIYNTVTDLHAQTKYDKGDQSVFNLINYKYIDAVILYEYKLKDRDVINDIIRRGRACDKPIIMLSQVFDTDGVINVGVNEDIAFKDLVIHLIEHHKVRRFGCIAGFENNVISDKKVAIFRETLNEYGIPFDERFFGYGNFYDYPTKQVLKKFLEYRDEFPEAIVCINDSMAITTCEVLIANGINVPEDVLVTGFDGIEQGKLSYPSISTCALDKELYADYIIEQLELSTSSDLRRASVKVPYTFEPHLSCGCNLEGQINVNKAISDLQNRAFISLYFERSMTNMVSKITMKDTRDELDEVLKHYINDTTLESDSYICANYDEKNKEVSTKNHTYLHNSFTKKVVAKRYFNGEKEIRTTIISQDQLVPNIMEILEPEGPLVIHAIHNQNQVYGYIVNKIVTDSFNKFSILAAKLQRFAANADNGMTLFYQRHELIEANNRLREVQDNIIHGFADLVESRDDLTGQHIKRTGDYIKVLVDHLACMDCFKDELDEAKQELICRAAPLHDIGKIKISDTVLNKPGKLDPDEFEIIKTHTTEGSKIIMNTLSNLEEPEYLRVAKDMVLYHHEKWNGNGYPRGLKGEQIPLAARIMAVVDVFDALSSERVYKKAFPMDKTFSILEESRGTHFDPKIVDTFINIRKEIEDIYYNID